MVRMGAQGVTSEDDIQGAQKPLPGRYHVSIKDVEPQFKVKDEETKREKWETCFENEADRLSITFEVLAGTTPGQEGREVSESYFLSEKAMPRLQRLGLSVGLIKPGQAEEDVPFGERGPGCQLVIELEENSFTGRDGKEVKTVRVSYLGMWSLTNSQVADVPKDQEAMRLSQAGETVGQGQQAEQTQQAEQGGQEAAGAATGSGEDDKWADL